MAPTIADIVFISQMYLAGGSCPVLLVPFLSFKDVAQGPFLLVLRLGPGAHFLFVAVKGVLLCQRCLIVLPARVVGTQAA